MKRKILLAITAVIASAMLLTVSATAKKPTDWTYYAYGTINDYQNAPSATIVDGYWNLKIEGNKIWLQMNYMEKNLDPYVEGSPEGSVDLMEFTFMGQPMVFMEGEDTLDVFGVMKVRKTWAMFDGTYNEKTWKTWMWFTFTFDGEGGTVFIDTYPSEGEEPEFDPENPGTYDWDRTGVIIDYNYPPQ